MKGKSNVAAVVREVVKQITAFQCCLASRGGDNHYSELVFYADV
jgi:hypothetical protein